MFSPFNSLSRPNPTDLVKLTDAQRAEHNRIRGQLFAQALEKEEAFIASFPSITEAIAARLQHEINQYDIRFERWGDYLVVYESPNSRRKTKFVQSINVGKNEHIILHEGSPAASDGQVVWGVFAFSRDDFITAEDANGMPAFFLKNGPTYHVGKRHNLSNESYEYVYLFDHITRNVPKGYVNGTITFVSAKVTLHVPYGLTKKVFDDMHEEIRRGWENAGQLTTKD